jgi:hypothetical protein
MDVAVVRAVDYLSTKATIVRRGAQIEVENV